jgi:Glycosyl transferase family 2
VARSDLTPGLPLTGGDTVLLERIGQLRRETTKPPEAPTLSVVVRTQGRRLPGLLETLTCLAAQSSEDFEVVVVTHDATAGGLAAVHELALRFAPSFGSRVRVLPVTGGGRSRSLNEGVEYACGFYIAFLDDDDLVGRDWIAAFIHGIRRSPGAIVRCRAATQYIERVDGPLALYRAVGSIERPFPDRFDLVRHLHQNRTPICSFAVPSAVFGAIGLRFSEELEVYEDWDLLVNAAAICGVHDTGEYTSIYHQWRAGESSVNTVSVESWAANLARLRDEFDTKPLLLPPGSAHELIQLIDHDEQHSDLQAFMDGLADARRRLAIEWRMESYFGITLGGELRHIARRIGTGLRRRLRKLHH